MDDVTLEQFHKLLRTLHAEAHAIRCRFMSGYLNGSPDDTLRHDLDDVKIRIKQCEDAIRDATNVVA